jgi:hypothetical protein
MWIFVFQFDGIQGSAPYFFGFKQKFSVWVNFGSVAFLLELFLIGSQLTFIPRFQEPEGAFGCHFFSIICIHIG